MELRLPHLIEPYRRDGIVNCSYELRLGPEAFVTGKEAKIKCRLSTGQQLYIPPGQFAELLTLEAVRVPDDALALISMKSKLKLLGLINVSGFHVDPGYHGRLLFSVYNAGPNDVVLSEGAPTFLMWYSSLDGKTSDLYDGKRDGQMHISDDDVRQIHGDVFTPQALAARVEGLERELEVLDEKFVARQKRVSKFVWILVTAVVSVLITLGVTWAVGKAGENSRSGTDQREVETPAVNFP